MIKTLLDFCPKTKEIIEKKKNEPIAEERLAALESAIADLAILLANNQNVKVE